MTADPPHATRPGHAEDCGACLYGALPDADHAGIDPPDMKDHTRRPPPTPPRLARWPVVVVLVGLVFVAGTWISPILGLVGGLIMLPGVTAWGYIVAEWRSDERRWRADHRAWKAEQTQVWRDARTRGEPWYCPTCADLACPNEHGEDAASAGP